MQAPLASVCLITYNQLKYIRQAIDGILMQNTDFTWELIIADDYSTDGTRNILIEYKNRFPEKIKLILQSSNKGAMLNWIELVSAPQSKYIALCEGDDCWTDSSKLHKQIEFLESNPEYVACYHSVQVINSHGKIVKRKKNRIFNDRDLSQADLMKGRVMSTSSLCYRNVIRNFPDEFYNSPIGDNFLCSLLGNHGKAKYLDTIMPSSYRMHNEGSWSFSNEISRKKNLLKSYFMMWKYYDGVGLKEISDSFYQKIILEGFYSDPFYDVEPRWLAKTEYLIVRFVRRIFRLLRKHIK